MKQRPDPWMRRQQMYAAMNLAVGRTFGDSLRDVASEMHIAKGTLNYRAKQGAPYVAACLMQLRKT